MSSRAAQVAGRRRRILRDRRTSLEPYQDFPEVADELEWIRKELEALDKETD